MRERQKERKREKREDLRAVYKTSQCTCLSLLQTYMTTQHKWIHIPNTYATSSIYVHDFTTYMPPSLSMHINLCTNIYIYIYPYIHNFLHLAILCIYNESVHKLMYKYIYIYTYIHNFLHLALLYIYTAHESIFYARPQLRNAHAPISKEWCTWLFQKRPIRLHITLWKETH